MNVACNRNTRNSSGDDIPERDVFLFRTRWYTYYKIQEKRRKHFMFQFCYNEELSITTKTTPSTNNPA